MIYLLSFLAFWLACGFVAAGFIYAYNQGAYPLTAERYRYSDRRHAWHDCLFGIAVLVLVLIENDYRHGWRKWW